jgi:hypothetical protein
MAAQYPHVESKPPKPHAFFLAGDSKADRRLGWGNDFLNTTLRNGVTGTSYGHNGATTVSFRADGDWATVLNAVARSVPRYTPYVTIQFGHHDQKPAKNISMAQLCSPIRRPKRRIPPQ